MYIFLDESGDLGFNFEKENTSKFFVITLLACPNKKTVDAFHSSVKKTLKNKINHKSPKVVKHELKASMTLHHVKEYFYKQVEKSTCSEWAIYSVILNKPRLLQRIEKQPEPKQLYNVLAKKALENIPLGNEISRVELVVDRCKDDKEIKIFNEYLSNHLASKLPLHSKLVIDHIPSRQNTGLQAVDMWSWGIFRKYETNDLEWYSLFCKRIEAEEQV